MAPILDSNWGYRGQIGDLMAERIGRGDLEFLGNRELRVRALCGKKVINLSRQFGWENIPFFALMAGLDANSLNKKLELLLAPEILLIDEVDFDRLEQRDGGNAHPFHKVID